jgi:hypothetical protein
MNNNKQILFIFLLLRIIRFELMISTWKVDVIPLNYTRYIIL